MRKWIMTAAALTLFGGFAFAADEETKLDTFEVCNNWARQFCTSGAHERAVNAELLKLKQHGIPITLERIKLMAQTINMGKVQQAEQAEQ